MDRDGNITALDLGTGQVLKDQIRRAYVGPSSYKAVGNVAVAAGRAFVPACPSDGNLYCVGPAELMIYSVKQ